MIKTFWKIAPFYVVFVVCLLISILRFAPTLVQSAASQDALGTQPKLPRSLLGFSLGEKTFDLKRVLGKPIMIVGSNHGNYLVYESKPYKLWSAFLIHDNRVESIVLIPKKDQISSFKDQFGVGFGDDISKLEHTRPNPIPEPPDMLTYSMGSERFVYGMRGDQIYAIEVTSGSTNIPPILVDFEYNGATTIQAI